MISRTLAGAAIVLAALMGGAGTAAAADAHVRVVDVGNGLCVVGRTPDGHSFLYDAGDRGSYCLDAVKAMIPESKIDVIILSHSDADHIGELPEILAERSAGTIFHTDDDHPITNALREAREAIEASKPSGTKVVNLRLTPLKTPDPERVFKLGPNGSLTIIAGWSDGDLTKKPNENPLPGPEHRNAVSIVARFVYGGHSILLTGDTVGRLHTDSTATSCRYAEREMVAHKADWPIDSDVLIGQHHGSNNASTKCFIREVSPTFVVFSAGHKNYRHPNASVAARYLAAGLDPDNMLRTDRGDDEGPGEWIYGSIRGCEDRAGDDDVELWLPDSSTASIRANYRVARRGC